MAHENQPARSIPLADFAGLSAEEREALARIVAAHQGLDDVFAWGRRQSPPVHPADVIKQDEFTHDVLVPLPEGRWLVYGTT
ncbi:MAG TPA: hypothetical protein VF310_08850 [Vicinamibacteria bacterium]